MFHYLVLKVGNCSSLDLNWLQTAQKQKITRALDIKIFLGFILILLASRPRPICDRFVRKKFLTTLCQIFGFYHLY